MLDIRLALEVLSVSQCCKLINDEEMDELKAIFESYKKKWKKENMKRQAN